MHAPVTIPAFNHLDNNSIKPGRNQKSILSASPRTNGKKVPSFISRTSDEVVPSLC
jgi:hypothetical protein